MLELHLMETKSIFLFLAVIFSLSIFADDWAEEQKKARQLFIAAEKVFTNDAKTYTIPVENVPEKTGTLDKGTCYSYVLNYGTSRYDRSESSDTFDKVIVKGDAALGVPDTSYPTFAGNKISLLTDGSFGYVITYDKKPKQGHNYHSLVYSIRLEIMSNNQWKWWTKQVDTCISNPGFYSTTYCYYPVK